MAETKSSAVGVTAKPDLVLTRIFDAPRELVFKAWTDPKHVARWWGPHGFRNPVCELDVRPGGAIRIDMHAPEGIDHPMTGIFREIVAPERLEFVSAAMFDEHGSPAFEILNTVTFDEHNGKTKLTLIARIIKSSPQAAPALAGMEQGWSESLERLRDLLASDCQDALADRDIVIRRLVDAPRELVFEAWTNPNHVANWWGPNDFTTTIQEMDVRPGGVWRLVMRGPDGTDYKNKIVFSEVVKPERLVFKHEPEKGTEPGTHETTVTFVTIGGKTLITMRLLFKSAAAREHVVQKYNAVEGGKQTIGRLAEYLMKLARESDLSAADSADPEFVVSRVFDAPRDLVFKALTERERLAKWWGPKGFAWVSSTLDLHPGGMFHYCMRSPDGREMWGKFVYREIMAPERIVFVNSFSNEKGETVRAPFNEAWPLEVLNTLTLIENEGRTILTLRGKPVHATEPERKVFEAGYEHMQQGFKGTLDQLADYLSKV